MIGRVLAILILAATGLAAQVSHDKLVFVVVDPAGACANRTAVQYNPLTGNLWGCKNLVWTNIGASGAGSGTVTSFSAGTLSPLFTTSVATATTTPALSFALSNAGAGTVFGNRTGSSGAPAYTAAPVLGLPGTTIGTLGLAGNTSGTATVTPQAAAGTPTLTLPTTSGTLASTATSPLVLNATTGVLTCPTCQTTGVTTNQNIRTIGASFGSFQSGATALSAAVTSCTPVYYAGTIQSVEIVGDVSGSATIDVKTVAHSSWTGTASTSSITAAAIPTLSSASRYTDSTLTGWTISVTAGTDFCFVMTAPTTVAGLSIALKVAAN